MMIHDEMHNSAFISSLQTLQHLECEELQYLSGGIVSTVMKRSNIQKEKELVALKEIFDSQWKTVTNT